MLAESDSLLESRIGVLPAPKEERAVVLLKDVAEHNAKLKRVASCLHPRRGEVRECLENDLIFDPLEKTLTLPVLPDGTGPVVVPLADVDPRCVQRSTKQAMAQATAAIAAAGR